MSEFPGNSNKAKKAATPPEKRVEKVISGKAVRRKKPLGMRFRELFLTGEDSRSVFEYMLTEHIRPGIKDAVFAAVTGGLEAKFYPGEIGSYRRSSRSPIVSNGLGLFTDYASKSRSPIGGSVREERVAPSRRSNHNLEITIPTKPEAELVLETMYEIIGRHEECSVSDLLQMVGETPVMTDEKFGWTSLEGSRPYRHPGGGYGLRLPPPIELS